MRTESLAATVALATRDAKRPNWRTRWAERENERRRCAHDADAESWRRRADELIRLRAEVTCFYGYHQPSTDLPVDLEDDEVLFRVLPAVELVEAEARHRTGLPAPGLAVTPVPADAPGPALPRGLGIADTGMAAVTSRRLVFAGPRGRRQWWYADLIGPAHHPQAPVTLLHTTRGGKLAGLRVLPESALNFRLYLTLAFADVRGDRDAVAAYLDEQVTVHERARPALPDPAEEDEAPLIALLHDRRIAVGAAAVAMLVTAVGIVGPGRPAPDIIRKAPAIGVVGTVDSTGGAVSATSAAPAPTGPGGRAAAPPANKADAGKSTAVAGVIGGGSAPVQPSPSSAASGKPEPQQTSSGPQTSPSPSVSPTEIDRCGAPRNPYGYTYCGGTLIREPAADVCSYFPCMDDFWIGIGHVLTCKDGLVGLVGGLPEECAGQRGLLAYLNG
ncbi:hypothetical protein ACNAW0_11030 [Micromonospora sp. SL1-18]|uniref:hypothetical protein n=1 Tax=Micromonospora sp. SL1-18 TaxID=3399128 RepID=UPI003A4DFA16